MHLNHISILNYKNIEQLELSFSSKLNCFLGDNGAGKTNLLDAIYFLSFTKSFFNNIDSLNVKHDTDFFMLQGLYTRGGDEETVSCGFKNGQKKQFKIGQKNYKRLSDHIGLFPLVIVSPADTILIIGGSEERRKFMDGVISQYDRSYLEALIRYNRALLQRNNLLKLFSDNHSFDSETLSIYDEQLIDFGQLIYQKRNEFIAEMIPVFQHFYNTISGGKEIVHLEYISSLSEGRYREQLIENQRKDLAAQYTNIGIHKDDLQLSLGSFPIKKLGSQGQTKTYLLALKFAQFEFIKKISGIKPILLLDDIFDKLDARRVSKIIELVSNDQFGQIFVTDTNRDHLESILAQMDTNYLIFRIEEGRVVEA
jgi:DNA replication and repair protein RecF